MPHASKIAHPRNNDTVHDVFFPAFGRADAGVAGVYGKIFNAKDSRNGYMAGITCRAADAVI